MYSVLTNDKNYKNLVNDIIKYSTILVIVNLLFYVSKPNTTFFNSIFIDVESFVVVGLCLYWLIVKKLTDYYLMLN